MKIGCVILCRYNSSRLPGKILKEVKGKTILQHIIDRLRLINGLQIIVATSNQSTDDIIEEYCLQAGISIFRGSLENVSKRFLEAAQSLNLDYAIRYNGDNLFSNLDIIEEMISACSGNHLDFISNVHGRTFPYGMSVEIINIPFYQALIKQFESEYHREHVTIYLYENQDIGRRKYFYNTKHKELQGLRLAIDESQDLQFAEKVLSHLEDRLVNYTFDDLFNAIAKAKK